MSDAISDGYEASREYQWANQDGKHGMASVEALEAQGWVKVRESEAYKGSWLMRKA